MLVVTIENKRGKKIMFGRTYSDLGSVVGQINGEDIHANQLERRGYDWENGYGTPSDG